MEKKLWKFTIAIVATHDEKEELSDRLVQTICPSAEHSGECPIPWALRTVDGESLDPDERKELEEEIRWTNPPSD